MPSDKKNENENLSFSLPLGDGPTGSEAKPFSPDQMIRCEECLRANGPTRVNCLYCGSALPFNESSVNLQKPALRPLEKWEQGYNNILLPSAANDPLIDITHSDPRPSNLTDADVAEAADLLKLTPEDLARILSLSLALPLARASTIDEASLIKRRLSRLRIDTIIVPDLDLGVPEKPSIKVRSLEIGPTAIVVFQTPETSGTNITWSSLILAVLGRLVVRRVELREQKTSRAEHRILDSNEFFADESVVEIYVKGQATPYRIAANSFDFSCLDEKKKFVAGENLLALLDVFREHAPQLAFDDTYKSARKALEAVWPSQRQNEAGGWRRDRPGKISIGSTTEISNELQFSRYSRLRHYFGFKSREEKDENA